MLKLPISEKRITWFLSFMITIVFLLIYYSIKPGYSLVNDIFKNEYYSYHTFSIPINDQNKNLTGEIYYPKYYISSSSIPVYIKIDNKTDETIENLSIWAYTKPSEYNENKKTENFYIPSFLFINKLDNYLSNKIIFDKLDKNSESIKKINIINQHNEIVLLDFQYAFEGNSPEKFEIISDKTSEIETKTVSNEKNPGSINNVFKITQHNLKGLKTIILPYLLLPPFSNAVIPIIILFIGYFLEPIFLKNNSNNEDEIKLLVRYLFKLNKFFILVWKYSWGIFKRRNLKLDSGIHPRKKVQKYKISIKKQMEKFFKEENQDQIKSIFFFIIIYLISVFELYLLIMIFFTPIEKLLSNTYKPLPIIIFLNIIIIFLLVIKKFKEYKFIPESIEEGTCSENSSHKYFYYQRICHKCSSKYGEIKDFKCMDDDCQNTIHIDSVDYCESCLDKNSNQENSDSTNEL